METMERDQIGIAAVEGRRLRRRGRGKVKQGTFVEGVGYDCGGGSHSGAIGAQWSHWNVSCPTVVRLMEARQPISD